jgi:hypothetical protein
MDVSSQGLSRSQKKGYGFVVLLSWVQPSSSERGGLFSKIWPPPMSMLEALRLYCPDRWFGICGSCLISEAC